jgi:hypothetical protein
MTDHTPDPDLQRIVEEMAPAEDRTIEIVDPSPELRELVEIAQQLDEPYLQDVLGWARVELLRQKKHRT